jgi:hypothetical protein
MVTPTRDIRNEARRGALPKGLAKSLSDRLDALPDAEEWPTRTTFPSR